MPKVVVDTNVLVAALLHPDRKPAQVVQLILQQRVVNYTSPSILEEVAETILEFSGSALLEKYRSHSRIIRPTICIRACSDPDDDKFIECALAAGASFIITGDKELLEIGSIENILIITPQEFLDLS